MSELNTEKAVLEKLKGLANDCFSEDDFKFLKTLSPKLLTDKVKRRAVKITGHCLKYIKNQDEKLCSLALNTQEDFDDRFILSYVKKPTLKLYKKSLKIHSQSLEFVKKQTEDLCLIAVRQDGLALKFVKNQTPKICKAAVRQDGLALMWVKNQTLELCKIAMQNGQPSEVLDVMDEKFRSHFKGT